MDLLKFVLFIYLFEYVDPGVLENFEEHEDRPKMITMIIRRKEIRLFESEMFLYNNYGQVSNLFVSGRNLTFVCKYEDILTPTKMTIILDGKIKAEK